MLNNSIPPNLAWDKMDNSQEENIRKLSNVLRKSSTSLIIKNMGIKTLKLHWHPISRSIDCKSINQSIPSFANSFGKPVGGGMTHYFTDTLLMVM